jgi:hypothetical protein
VALTASTAAAGLGPPVGCRPLAGGPRAEGLWRRDHEGDEVKTGKMWASVEKTMSDARMNSFSSSNRRKRYLQVSDRK